MKKEFKLNLDKWDDWRSDNKDVLCNRKLRLFFKIPKRKKALIGILSDKPMANSYKLRASQSSEAIMVDGENIEFTYSYFRHLINNHFNGVCYARIEWEES